MGMGYVLPPNVGFDISRRHQLHIMAERPQLPPPVMRRPARLDPHAAVRQLAEEIDYLATLERPVDDHFACRIKAVNLKYHFCQIETNNRDRRQIGCYFAPRRSSSWVDLRQSHRCEGSLTATQFPPWSAVHTITEIPMSKTLTASI